MYVLVERDGRRGVAERQLHGLDARPRVDKQGRVVVPQPVKAPPRRQSDCGPDGRPGPRERGRVNRLATRAPNTSDAGRLVGLRGSLSSSTSTGGSSRSRCSCSAAATMSGSSTVRTLVFVFGLSRYGERPVCILSCRRTASSLPSKSMSPSSRPSTSPSRRPHPAAT